MDTNKMREQFEDWFVKIYFGGVRDKKSEEWLSRDEVSGGYLYRDPSQEWQTWQASREAVVVELPKVFPDESVSSVHSKCVRAIEAQGVKCK